MNGDYEKSLLQTPGIYRGSAEDKSWRLVKISHIQT